MGDPLTGTLITGGDVEMANGTFYSTATPQLTIGHTATSGISVSVGSDGVPHLGEVNHAVNGQAFYIMGRLHCTNAVENGFGGDNSLMTSGGLLIDKNLVLGVQASLNPAATLWKEKAVQYILGMSGAPAMVSHIGSNYYPAFSGTADNVLAGTWHVPFDWKFNSSLRVTIWWCGINTNVGYVGWTLTYAMCIAGIPTSTAGTSVAVNAWNNTGAAYIIQKLTLAVIDDTLYLPYDGASFTFTLKRNGATDSYNSNAYLLGWTVSYNTARLGSWNPV
jgi:hypothetical protein